MKWLIIIAALALTALMLACIWVASDVEREEEERRANDEQRLYQPTRSKTDDT